MCDFIINHWAALLDAASKLATVIAAVGIWVAYRQYRHSVTLAQTNERRSAVELAARECARFGDEITKKLLALNQEIEKSGCEYQKHCKVIKELEQIKLDTTAVTDEDNQKINKLFPQILDMLNSLEGFAIPFASNVADDKVGFSECGRAFVDFFENLFPLYRVNLRDYYQSTQNVYWRWKKQANQMELERQHAQAGKEFFILSEKLVKGGANSWFSRKIAVALRELAEQFSKSK